MKTQKNQKGYIWKSGRSWFARWYRDELVDTGPSGERRVVRRQHAEKLCDFSDRYRTRRDVEPLLAAKLVPLNEGRASAESTMSVADFGDKHYLPFVKKELSPSTAYGYAGVFRMYLRPRLTNINLRDYRCVDATNLLAAIHREHDLSRKSLRSCKALLSSLFTYAKRTGVLDGINPVEDAGIPKKARVGGATTAYSVDEIFQMLHVLQLLGKDAASTEESQRFQLARTAIGLMFFAGLRPGEARFANWEHFDGRVLRICGSRWRKIDKETKTVQSAAPVPIGETLCEILAETRRKSGYILAGPGGQPTDLSNLATRVIRPALARCAKCRKPKTGHVGHEFVSLPKWRGAYACRRGAATVVTQVSSALGAKGLLRHADISTTAKHYIKDVPSETLAAMKLVDALFQNVSSAAPN
jgi:integrase